MFSLFVALTGLAAVPAHAEGDQRPPAAVDARTGLSLAQWECSVGDLCVWTGQNGTGSRCAWTNSDNDWLAGAIQCSWAAGSDVHSLWNRGTSTGYSGVAVYNDANYVNRWWCSPQGTVWTWEYSGVRLRSHRWVSGTC
ncbi:peptidase inhibitor family I36 protein [Longispora sp. K20-0274]|uniref:peptidase inhibitor family I36 protein n=1 Tax=Longispora sp. K20-0274 TaxID=3088255 RepID=UPI00399ADFE8